MYEIKVEDTFLRDVNHWVKEIPNLWDEIQAVTEYMQETGEVPEEYDPHLLTNDSLNYVGYLEFHLLDGKIDLLVIHTKNDSNKVFRLVRLGTHKELFHSNLR